MSIFYKVKEAKIKHKKEGTTEIESKAFNDCSLFLVVCFGFNKRNVMLSPSHFPQNENICDLDSPLLFYI